MKKNPRNVAVAAVAETNAYSRTKSGFSVLPSLPFKLFLSGVSTHESIRGFQNGIELNC